VQLVPLEGTHTRATIKTPNFANSCASNSATGTTVCSANNTDVYIIKGSTLAATLTSGATGFAPFSAGIKSCQTCGVAMDPSGNTAWLTIGLASGAPPNVVTSGFQALDLATNKLGPPIAGFASGSLEFTAASEAILIDPLRHLLLSPSELGTYALVQTQAPNATFLNPIPGSVMDSAAEDCTTGITVAPLEEPSSGFLVADLTRATFTPGTPFGSWTAPNQIQDLPEIGGGLWTAMAVAPKSHLAIVTQTEDFTDAIGVIQLPSSSGTGTPAVVDWAMVNHVVRVPPYEDYISGGDPHVVSAYVSPNDGKAYGVIADFPTASGLYLGRQFIAIVDLQGILDAPRTPGTHNVIPYPTFDVVKAGLVRFVSVH